MTNIKNIGKELLGKTLNSFHKSTGLQSVERNNEMQTKILQGIYSQVDNEYLEKTEEGNVIHLDGSGDGVVELESIEGNSLVNLVDIKTCEHYNSAEGLCTHTVAVDETWKAVGISKKDTVAKLKPNTVYTVVMNIVNNSVKSPSELYMTITNENRAFVNNIIVPDGYKGVLIKTLTTRSDLTNVYYGLFPSIKNTITGQSVGFRYAIIEGDYTNKPIPPKYFEGLKSCFEEKKVGDKYEVEVEVVGGNLLDVKTHVDYINSKITNTEQKIKYQDDIFTQGNNLSYSQAVLYPILVRRGYKYTFDAKIIDTLGYRLEVYNSGGLKIQDNGANNLTKPTTFEAPSDIIYLKFTAQANKSMRDIKLECNGPADNYTSYESNKIKLYINEPLRGLPNGVKDRLCIVDNKLMVERNCKRVVMDGSETGWSHDSGRDGVNTKYYRLSKYSIKEYYPTTNNGLNSFFINNNYKCETASRNWAVVSDTASLDINKDLNISVRDSSSTLTTFKDKLLNNNIDVIFELMNPTYEEVTNEYGEPVLLEGYENGTIYIDSIIPPTTTVKYTQKFASRNAVKDLSKDNTLVMHDINATIVPHMMDVDMMLMEKEMSVMQDFKINKLMKMEVLDMTSMQKRTQEMLERLFRGQSLTEQECKDRVVIYLNADKITSAQAEELMLVIAEVYK